jgi:7-cyano-7-deazaguanine tRNA-ribosyltransferase
MLIVAGLSLKNLEPRVWDPTSEYYLPNLQAVMLSYAELGQNKLLRDRAMRDGARALIGKRRRGLRLFLDNGAFHVFSGSGVVDRGAYRKFVRKAALDWYPIPFDSIPSPGMSSAKQRKCFEDTMAVNHAHHHDGYVPVIHVGRHLEDYIAAMKRSTAVTRKPWLALGGIVPNLLRAPKAASYTRVLECLSSVCEEFPGKKIHVFGIGGTATVHLAALLGFASVDSSGWRNRAARGIVQLPGHGDRVVANLGNWRGRTPDHHEWSLLRRCKCPACVAYGVKGLKEDGLSGFCNRATHNLHVLLEEELWVRERLKRGTYPTQFRRRLNNSVYLPLIEQLVHKQAGVDTGL